MFISCKRNLRTFPSVKAARVSVFLGGKTNGKTFRLCRRRNRTILGAGMEPEYFVGSERFVSAALGTETCQSTKRRHRSSGSVPDLSDQIFLIKNRIFS